MPDTPSPHNSAADLSSTRMLFSAQERGAPNERTLSGYATDGDGIASGVLAARYRRGIARRLLLLLIVTGLGVCAILADLAIGSGTLTLQQVLMGLLHPSEVDIGTRVILHDIRMPITFTAALSGIGLGLAGALMQTSLQNPLAEPFTIGISSAAGCGAAIAIVFQASLASLMPWLPPDMFVSLNAFVFALLTVLFISVFARSNGLGIETVTLLGIAIHFVFASALGMMQYFSDADQLQTLVFWLMGSLLKSSWLKVGLNFGVIIVLLPLVLLNSRTITTLRSFGDQAATLGVNVPRTRFLMLFAAALLASGITATIGVVGFVGLVAPHISRLLVGEDQRFSLPMTAACGMLVMTLASIASKMILPGGVLPIGMVTSLLGVPFFLAQILWLKKRGMR
ncbi:iron ABC transporter permease [Robbsia sp. KACC 23696]|uniref:FecCD family ABC transporter permease n=1 Tax=Robbsia sp. KACC 23696 TaxID=3149231 RepID=UPI00325BF147